MYLTFASATWAMREAKLLQMQRTDDKQPVEMRPHDSSRVAEVQYYCRLVRPYLTSNRKVVFLAHPRREMMTG